MDKQANPYQKLSARNFWRSGVVDPGPFGISELVDPKFQITRQDRIVTAGSCFAQRLNQTLTAWGYNCPMAEQPSEMLDPAHHARFNYGIYSARTGNIYTPAVLRQWISWAFDAAPDDLEIWPQHDGRVQDAFRPEIEPGGFESIEELNRARHCTFAALCQSLTQADVFVMTLGGTEAWRNKETGLIYPSCPGTVAGQFDQNSHELVNFQYPKLREDLEWIIDRLHQVNPKLNILFTVSPIPLTATAEPNSHALVANTYTKSTLRAVVGDLARDSDQVDYFPSYELFVAPPFRAMFYAPNMRSVDPFGVNYVMERFVQIYGESGTHMKPQTKQTAASNNDEDLVCHDFILDYYNGN
jgi:hypothetical protein